MTGGLSNMQVQENPKLQAIFRDYVGRNQAVISRPISRDVTPNDPLESFPRPLGGEGDRKARG